MSEVKRHRGRLRSNGWQDESIQEYVHASDHEMVVASYQREIQTWYDKLQAADAEIAALRSRLEEAMRFVRHPMVCHATLEPSGTLMHTFTVGDQTKAPNCTCGLNDWLSKENGGG